MKRLITFFALLLYGISFSSNLHIGPYLQNVTPNSITIVWETDEAVKGYVRYGMAEHQLIYTSAENNPVKIHRIMLKSLTPQQGYYYRCFWGNDSSIIGKFTTAPANMATNMRLMIYGDSRNNPKIHQKIFETASVMNPLLVINTGDLVGDGNIYSNWKEQLFDPIKDFIINLPYYAVPGNHENESPNYYDYFAFNDDKKWWSTDYGMVHIIGLNSNIDGDPESEQYRWLEDDLRQNQDKPWKIVIFHHPLFHVHKNRAVYDTRYYWHPLFMKYGVDLAFSGHDHYYMRSYPIGHLNSMEQSVVYYITAGGGAPLYAIDGRPYAACAEKKHHFTILDISSDQINITAFTPEGEVFDKFTLHKPHNFSYDNFIEFAVYELEKAIIDSFANLFPSPSSPGFVQFNISFRFPHYFSVPIKCQVAWEADSLWEIGKYQHEFRLLPEDSLKISVSAKAPVDYAIPTPILKVHLEVDQTELPDECQRMNFINQDFEISIEKAAYDYAMAATYENIERIFNFTENYPKSQYVSRLGEHLNWLIYKKRDKAILGRIQQILQRDNSRVNKTYYLPIYFIFNDFTHYEEWLAALNSLPGNLQNELPGYLYFLSYMDNLNMQFITDWVITGTFAKNYAPKKILNFRGEFKSDKTNEVHWQKVSGDNDHFLDFSKYYSKQENKAAFAYAALHAKRRGKVLLLLGNSGETRVWMNKKLMFHKHINREAHHCQEVIYVDVKKGENNILIQTAAGDKDWGLYLQVLDKDSILTGK